MSENSQNIKIPPVGIYKVLTAFRRFLYNLYYKLVPANVALFEKTERLWIAKAIEVACNLNIADIIGSEEKTTEEIAKATGTNPDSLYRLMRALASDGIFKETGNRVFVNTSLSNGLRVDGGSMKYMIMHQLSHTNMKMLAELNYSVKTGKSVADKLFGTDIFTHLKNNPEKNELYNKAMTANSGLFSDAFVSSYSFKGDEKLIDIGGGEGLLLSKTLKKYPGMRGVVFDQPHVVKTAIETFNRFNVAGRAEIIAGDIFGKIPAGGDVYILKNILHIFDDVTCIKILKNIKSSMSENSRILIIETVISRNNKPEFGKLFDLQMLIGTEGGKERTAEEFEKVLIDAGFKLNRIIDTVAPLSIIEAKTHRT